MTAKTLIIAEAGVNHNGDIELARQLVPQPSKAGADLVKFQTFVTGMVVSKLAPKASYQIETTDAAETQYDMLCKLELSEKDHWDLLDKCRATGIEFFSTAFDLESVALLARMNLPRSKIPSGEITNLPLLRAIAKLGKPVILSTGMAGLGDIEAAIEVIEAGGLSRANITVLHCNTEYPTPYADVNLRAMRHIGEALGVAYGYSDHTKGIEIPIAAVTLGASVIEKHFTLDRQLPGPDHKASLEPQEFVAMVQAIRNVEEALGDGIKRPTEGEKKNLPIARKSLIAARTIAKGELFTAENLTTKRPGTGISPMRWDEIIGRPSPRTFSEDEMIEL